MLKLCKKKVARSRKKYGLEMNIQTTGLTIRNNVPADGNCLFHAVTDQLRCLKIKRTRHIDMRREVVQYLRLNPTIVSVDGWIYTCKNND